MPRPLELCSSSLIPASRTPQPSPWTCQPRQPARRLPPKRRVQEVSRTPRRDQPLPPCRPPAGFKHEPRGVELTEGNDAHLAVLEGSGLIGRVQVLFLEALCGHKASPL